MEDNSIDSERVAALVRENQELRAAHEERLVDIAVLGGLLEEAEARGRRAAEKELGANLARVAADRDKWRQRHQEVLRTTSWKVTGPFRRAVRLLKKLRSS